MKHPFQALLWLTLALLLILCAVACSPSDDCTHAETELQNATSATCLAKGYTGDTVCRLCGVTVTAGTEITFASCKFALTGNIIAAPTCETQGTTERKCSVCGKRGVPAPVEPLGHELTYTDAVEDAEGGLSTDLTHTVTCNREGCDYAATEIHTGTPIIQSATCSKSGYKSGTCTTCGVRYSAADPSKPATNAHTWSEGTVQGASILKECLNADCTATKVVPVTPPDTEPEPADHVDSDKLYLAMTEFIRLKPYTDDKGVYCRIVQGGCTDGTYYYVAINDGQSSNANSVSMIRKYDLATGDLVATFENMKIAHANDLCYNPVTNEIIAVHNSPVRQLISILDADSLELKRQVTLALEIYSMSYDPYEDCYWVGLSYGYNFAKLNTAFEQVGSIYTGRETGFTKQGMDVDSKYIYFLQYNTNCIIVYNKQGAYVGQIDLPQTAYEAENICHIGDVFYIGYFESAGGTLYKTVLNAPTPPSVTATLTELSTLPQYTDGAGNLCHMAQGSCSDGTYIYLAMNNDNSADYTSAIYKIDPQTGAIIATVEGFEAGLANDLCYNTRTDEIVAVQNKPDATKLSVYSAESLELLRTVTLTYNVYAIAYDAVLDCYWLGLSGTYDFALLNTDFEKQTTYTGRSSGYTKQGMDCDGTYIYFVQSAENNLVIYRTDGSYVGACALPTGAGSAQSICHVDNICYIVYNTLNDGAALYTAEITIE